MQRVERSRGVDLGSYSFHFLTESSYCRAWSESAINLSSRPKVNQEVHFGLTQSSPINHHFGSLPAGIFTMAVLTDLFEGCSFFRPHSKPVSLHGHKCPPLSQELSGFWEHFSHRLCNLTLLFKLCVKEHEKVLPFQYLEIIWQNCVCTHTSKQASSVRTNTTSHDYVRHTVQFW